MLCTRNEHSIVGQLILKKNYKQTSRKKDQICGYERQACRGDRIE